MYLSYKQNSVEIRQYLIMHVHTCTSILLSYGLFSGTKGFFSVWRVYENTKYFCSTVCQSWLWKRQFGTQSLKLDFRKQEAPGKWCATLRDFKYTLAKPKFPKGPQSAKGEAVTLDTCLPFLELIHIMHLLFQLRDTISALASFSILVFTPVPECTVTCSTDTSKTYLKDVYSARYIFWESLKDSQKYCYQLLSTVCNMP